MWRLRLFGTAAVGAVVAVAAAILTIVTAAIPATPLAEPLVPWLYARLYRPLGPETAVLVAKGFGAVTLPLGMLLGVGVAGAVAADSATDRRRVGVLVGAQAVVAVVCLVIGAVASLAVLVVVAADAVALAALAVRWTRASARAPGTTLTTGSMPVVLLAFAMLSLVGLLAVNSSVTATELRSAPAGEQVVDAPPAVADTIASDQCRTNASTGLAVCGLPVEHGDRGATVRRFLDDHGVRCPMDGVSESSVVVAADGSYYRIKCETV